MTGNELETLIDIGLAAWRRQSPGLCDVENAGARDAMRAAVAAVLTEISRMLDEYQQRAAAEEQ